MKLRTTSGLSRSVATWVGQVTVSLGATLAATLIWSAVPHPGSTSASPPELTSGGKFAARAIEPAAFDGLDTMPLPHVAPARVAPVPTLAADLTAPPALLHSASWIEAPPLAAPEHPARPALQGRPLIGPRRAAPPSRAVPVAGTAAAVTEAAALPSEERDDGLLHRMIPSALPRVMPALASTVHDAWTVTTAAGGALVARIASQLP